MSQTPLIHETQQQRWIKYGGNVVLASIIVVILAVLIVWFGKQYDFRIDTTKSGIYSLKQQTVNIIKENKTPVRIVTLYSPTKYKDSVPQADRIDYRQPVIDLVDEYQRKGSRITVEHIDPEKNLAQLNQLVARIKQDYGGSTAGEYDTLLKDFPEIADRISKMANDELANFKKLPLREAQDSPVLQQLLGPAISALDQLPDTLLEDKSNIANYLKTAKLPDYRRVVDSVKSDLSDLSSAMAGSLADFAASKTKPNIPEAFSKYISEATPHLEEIKKVADDLLERINKLGDLKKLDDAIRSLDARDTILVLGDKEMKSISKDAIWAVPTGMGADGKLRRRFAGEQQITSAVLALSSKVKSKVVFVRNGGTALTTQGMPQLGMPNGEYSMMASRLRDYNFEVMEKDLSGAGGRSQNPFGPPSAEPSDADMKDAVWVVASMPPNPQQPPPPPGLAAAKLKEHLDSGGSAIVMGFPGGDNFAAALDPLGIKLRTDAIAVHAPVEAAKDSKYIVDRAQRQPIIFIVHNYGEHLITQACGALDGLLYLISPVETQLKAGGKTTRIIPIPETLKVWGETSDVQNLSSGRRSDPPEYKAGEDLGAPLFGGAISENGNSRLVVLGSALFAIDNFVAFPDEALAEKEIYSPRFPGNGELFMNSIFWLSHQDTMVSLSANALDVNRVGEVSPATLNIWKYGVLMILLPGLVVAAGLWMFFSRRD